MKILVLNFNLKGVGTYHRSFYFSRELARHGHEVTMITVSRDSRFRLTAYFKQDWIGQSKQPTGDGPWVRMIEGPRLGYKWLPGWGAGPLDIWLRIREILAGRYDVVYGFEYHPDVSWPIYLTKPVRNYRFFSDWCDWFAGSSNQFRGWRIAHKVDAFFEEKIRFLAEKVSVVSKVLRDRAVSIGIPRERIVHIPQGAATDYIRPLPQEEMRQRLGLPVGVPILAAVRNADMCREVLIFEQVLKQVPSTLFLMIGREAPKAMELACRLGINDHIIAAGWVNDEDYPRYLVCADVCYCPLRDGLNDRARWPTKILDFLSAGRATVTNGVGEVAPLFQNHEIGLLAEQGEERFASCIVSLLEDKERRRYYGENARRLMVEEWDWRLRGEQISRVVEGA
jgi:glycosyltransferase involved in cell wall biosynthesis